MSRGWGLSAGVAASLLLWGGAAAAGPAKVDVADENSATVSVIETTTLTRVAVVPVGKPPHVSVLEGGRPAEAERPGVMTRAVRHP